MAVLASTTAFCTLVWMNTDTFKLIKIYSEVPKDSAFILSKSRFDQCWHCWDTGMMVRQIDRQRESFSALYSRLVSVPALLCRCMTYMPINCYASYMSSLVIVTCLLACSLLRLPAVYFSYLQSTMTTYSLLWLPIVYFGYLYAT